MRLVLWTQPGLRITKLKLSHDPHSSVWDVGRCLGRLRMPNYTEQHVEVALPFSELPKYGVKAAIVAWAQQDGLNAKALGILDALRYRDKQQRARSVKY